MKNVAAGIMVLACTFFVLAAGGIAGAAEIGKVAGLTGEADLSKAGAAPISLQVGDSVYGEDVIRTKSGSRLVLTMVDGSRLTMAENTRLELKRYKTAGQPSGLLKITRGRLRAFVSKVFSERSESFQVRSPTAIAGVMGTDFAVIVEAMFTRVVVFEGLVSVRNIDPRIPERRLLRKNQSTIVREGLPPLPPVSLKILIQEVLGVAAGTTAGEGEEQADEEGSGEELLPANGNDIRIIPPDDPPPFALDEGSASVPPTEPPQTEPPTEPPPIDPPPADPPPPWGGPHPPPPAPPTDPPPPGKPDGPPGPPASPPGQTKKDI